MADECRSLKDVIGRMTEVFVFNEALTLVDNPKEFSRDIARQVAVSCPDILIFAQMVIDHFGRPSCIGCLAALGYLYHLADEDTMCAQWLKDRLPFMRGPFMVAAFEAFVKQPEKFVEDGLTMIAQSEALTQSIRAMHYGIGEAAAFGAATIFGLFLRVEGAPPASGEAGQLPQ